MATTTSSAPPQATYNKDAHTIILAQFSEKVNSKHYSDHDTVTSAIETVCQLYESKLKQDNPDKKKITYDIADLFAFIDNLPDMAALVFDDNTATYVPHNKDWIKRAIFQQLKEQAGQ